MSDIRDDIKKIICQMAEDAGCSDNVYESLVDELFKFMQEYGFNAGYRAGCYKTALVYNAVGANNVLKSALEHGDHWAERYRPLVPNDIEY